MGLFSKSKKRREAEFMAPQWLKQVQESIDIINSTKNPDTFFFRYDFLIETVNKLIDIEKYLKFKGDTPSQLMKQIKSKKVYTINDFIDRYYNDLLYQINKLTTTKAKERRINNFYQSLSVYFDHMELENINKVKMLDESLKNMFSNKLTVTNTALTNKKSIIKPKAFNYNQWYIMVSFGKTTSNNYEKAIYLAKNSPKYEEIIDKNGNPTHTATYSSSKEDFLDFIVLYDIVANWKSTAFIINGELIDKKTIGKIKYCYGDKCRSVKSDFCYGASYMTANPFGCHRLQISAANNPWWSYYKKVGSHYELDRDSMLERIYLAADIFKHCPDFNLDNIIKVAMSFPLILKTKEYDELVDKEMKKALTYGY